MELQLNPIKSDTMQIIITQGNDALSAFSLLNNKILCCRSTAMRLTAFQHISR